MDERATSEDPQCLFLVGSTAMASDEVAMEQQRQRAEEADPGGVRASQEANQTSLFYVQISSPMPEITNFTTLQKIGTDEEKEKYYRRKEERALLGF
nr:hypothetical protein CFP56_49906 [Quercus suber]